MKITFKIVAVLAALCLAPASFAQQQATPGTTVRPAGPVVVGQAMLQRNEARGVALVQAAPEQKSGGVIQLSIFGWLQPYADSIVQLLIAAGIAWFGKSRYGSMMDESSRQALETFLRNRASSLIADGAVKLQGKAVHVDSAFLARAASESAAAIPDALKRFGLTPDVVAQKIIDAIPQVPAGAAIVASAHAENAIDPQTVSRPVGAAPGFSPPVSGTA